MASAQLRRMRLGCDTRLHAPVVQIIGTTLAADESFSRLVDIPRVQGHNDLYGDCVPTAACNAVQTEMGYDGNFTPISDDLPLSIYKNFGFDPSNPATDRGMNPEDLFTWWKKNPINGYLLKSATRVNQADEAAVRHTIKTLRGVYLVVELALAQQGQKVWEAVAGAAGSPGSWGGHAIWADEYSAPVSGATSWGDFQGIDRSYFTTPGYVVGAYALDMVKA